MKGDKIKVTESINYLGTTPIPVYMVETKAEDAYVFDEVGMVKPTIAGGVKQGTIGIVQGPPVRAPRMKMQNIDRSTASAGGQDFVMIVPVLFEQYKRMAWIQVDFIQVIG